MGMTVRDGELTIDYQAHTIKGYPDGGYAFPGGYVGIGQPRGTIVSYEVRATWKENGGTWVATLYGYPGAEQDDLKTLIEERCWMLVQVDNPVGDNPTTATHQALLGVLHDGQPQLCPPNLKKQLLALQARREVKIIDDARTPDEGR